MGSVWKSPQSEPMLKYNPENHKLKSITENILKLLLVSFSEHLWCEIEACLEMMSVISVFLHINFFA